MNLPVLLAIDQGTTGTTILVVDAGGAVVDRAYREITQYYPRPGWVEHDAEEIWRSVVEATGELLQRTGASPAGVGITSQRETFCHLGACLASPGGPRCRVAVPSQY